jgi:TetR/AcrR family transcriptional repressor of nem operon
VPRSKAFDDATAVAAARDVFWEHGYASTSLAQLQAATGLSKSSLYETYGSKRGLFDRAVQSYLEVVIAPRLGPLETGTAGRAELVAYFTGLAGFFGQAPDRIARRGCLLLNTAMELTELDPAAAELVRAYRLRVRTAFARVAHTIFFAAPPPAPELAASSAGPAHPLDLAAEAERRAELLTAAQIGLMLTSRLDPALAARLAATMADDVRSW